MLLSVSDYCLNQSITKNEASVKSFLSFCRENFVRHVELLDYYFSDDIGLPEVRQYLEEYEISVSAFSISNNFIHESAEERRSQVEYVVDGISKAKKLDTKILRVFSGNTRENVTYEQAKEWITECYQKCVPYAEDSGIVMALENHGKFFATSDRVKAIIHEIDSPYFKATADTANFLLVDEDPIEALRNLGEDIAFVHMKDYVADEDGRHFSLSNRFFRCTALGKGDIDLRGIIDVLRQSSYDGFLSVEYEGTGNDISDTKESILHLRSLLEERNENG